jgi:hypothetical protein
LGSATEEVRATFDAHLDQFLLGDARPPPGARTRRPVGANAFEAVLAAGLSVVGAAALVCFLLLERPFLHAQERLRAADPAATAPSPG